MDCNALKGSGAPRKKGDRLSVSKNWIFSFKFESQLPLSKRVSKTVLRLGTCGTHMGILPESTDSLKTSYFSRESTFRMPRPSFGGGGYSYALTIPVVGALASRVEVKFQT